MERSMRGGSFFTINTLFLCVTSITEGRSLQASVLNKFNSYNLAIGDDTL